MHFRLHHAIERERRGIARRVVAHQALDFGRQDLVRARRRRVMQQHARLSLELITRPARNGIDDAITTQHIVRVVHAAHDRVPRWTSMRRAAVVGRFVFIRERFFEQDALRGRFPIGVIDGRAIRRRPSETSSETPILAARLPPGMMNGLLLGLRIRGADLGEQIHGRASGRRASRRRLISRRRRVSSVELPAVTSGNEAPPAPTDGVRILTSAVRRALSTTRRSFGTTCA